MARAMQISMGMPPAYGAADAAQTLSFKAAASPADLLPVAAPQTAMFTLTRMEQDPAYAAQVLTWPNRALLSLHHALEAAAAEAGMSDVARWDSHNAIIAQIQRRQDAAISKRRGATAVGVAAVLVLGAAGLYWVTR